MEAFNRSLWDSREDTSTASKRKFPINIPLVWALAFSTYSAVATYFHPDMAAELITYGGS